jgi:hypothetical protein
METKISLVEPLLERAEQYGKTYFELLKLKTLDKTADISSGLISRLFLAAVFSLFAIILNIALALWLGDLLGKNYYGFFIVAGFYAIAGTVLFFIHPFIKARVNNSIITQILN